MDSIAIGVGAAFASDAFVNIPGTLQMILSNGLFMVSISAILLNLLLNGKKPFVNDILYFLTKKSDSSIILVRMYV